MKFRPAWYETTPVDQRMFPLEFSLILFHGQARGLKLIKICKAEFKVAGTDESRHGSGNRCIIALHKDKSTVNVLLVYGKTDIGGGKETATWKNIIRENYPQYCELIS